jgi:hypothetical protein
MNVLALGVALGVGASAKDGACAIAETESAVGDGVGAAAKDGVDTSIAGAGDGVGPSCIYRAGSNRQLRRGVVISLGTGGGGGGRGEPSTKLCSMKCS